VLVVDVGTSGVRAAVVHDDGTVRHIHHVAVLPSSPVPGFVEFDARAMAHAVLEVACKALADSGPVNGVGITNQRASTVVWDRETGEPVGPGVGWQDLRTVGTCLTLRDQGIRLAPNESATKLAFLLDLADPHRTGERPLCFGTVDTWVAWTLSTGALHVTDATNAGVTGLLEPDATSWNPRVLKALRIPEAVLPTVVDSSGIVGDATALPGAPPICSIAGDQQASLIGQGCTRPGLAKATFGTGGMLDCCVGERRPAFERRGDAGTFPIVA
jgi:glycerol kinase